MHTSCGCGHEHALPNLADDPDVEQLIRRLLRDVFSAKGMALQNRELQQYFASQLWDAITSGYGKDFDQVSFDTPDWRMLASLQRDVVHFSAAKDYTMQRALANELIDETGRLRSESQFFKAAYAVTDQHVHTWLRAERNLSISSAQMASKWNHILQDADVFPLLQMDVVLDDGTTEICRPLDGIVRPVNDPFWDVWFPPNHWGCRTTVRQLADGEITPSSQIVYPDNVPPIFQVNLAKQGLAYPPNHPYYQRLPSDVGELKLLRKQTQQFARDRYEGYQFAMDQVGEVTVTWQGIKEMANQPHYDKIFQLQLLQSLPQLMKHAQFVGTVASEKGSAARQFHNFMIPGLPDFYLVVREMAHTGENQLYSIVERLRGI